MTGVQTCALPISLRSRIGGARPDGAAGRAALDPVPQRRGTRLGGVHAGVTSNHDGALQFMSAGNHETHGRCKQHTGGAWAIVDVSLDGLRSAVMPNGAPR